MTGRVKDRNGPFGRHASERVIQNGVSFCILCSLDIQYAQQSGNMSHTLCFILYYAAIFFPSVYYLTTCNWGDLSRHATRDPTEHNSTRIVTTCTDLG
ncbi:hypothetical protein AGABI2DRAFT_192799 [Agaricus bisporus var. bisporus H97]|uniref:hypothetical protein n=1 Tax=Agaricus bisporus var. bisporus (strain H97 / ATCC MYA-4626 / FGSC 10389) TaxID=936046 RepID=UPI00029F57DE|nr:hypothetical protein AGABI2DRAFT_192799 [Agaricus bisporus var. bisporus H97]EKV47622.1 hypothetical protein AGABI2DRAFT_192799 [Agaricus bisporus var. bisporus H97]